MLGIFIASLQFLCTKKCEERTQKDTLTKQRWARRAACDLAKCLKIGRNLDHNRATFFFSPLEVWCLPTPSTIKPEEREFVVDSGASMHVLSKKDLNSSEFETVRVSRNPAKFITPNGDVQKKAEATVYVRYLDLIETVQLLEDTLRDFLTLNSSSIQSGHRHMPGIFIASLLVAALRHESRQEQLDGQEPDQKRKKVKRGSATANASWECLKDCWPEMNVSGLMTDRQTALMRDGSNQS